MFEKQNLDLSENKKIINSKNGELSENRKLLNSQNDILQRIKSELNDFKILLNKKTNEIEQLRSELTQTIKLKHSETENLKNEILEKNQMLEFKEKETENLQKNLSDLKNSLKTQLNETEKPILELIETKQSLKAKNDEFEILQKDLFQIKNSLISKNEELEVLNEKLSHMQEYINLQESSQINDLNSIMNEKNQEIEILVKNFEDISKVYEEKTLENFALNEEKLELHEKTADMKNKIEEYEFILQTNEIRIKELEEQTGMLKSVRTEENSQRNNETPNFSQKQEEDFEHLKMINESLKKERDLMLQDFQFKYNEKERELQNLLSKNKNNFENIQEKDKYHETQISEMNFVIMDLKGNLLKKEEELSEIIMQKSKIEEINAQLEANFTNLQQSYNKILIKLKNKDEELSKLNIPEINGKDSQIITLKSLNADLCIQNDFLKKENQKLSIEAKTLSENLEQKSSKFETIQNTEPNSQEFNSLLARYELLSSEYQEINNIIREMIKEFFPSEDCPECHSTRTLLVRIQRIIRQKNEDNTIETNEEYNENPKKSKDDQEKMEDPEMFNNKNDEEELDMENELEEYRMIIKHLEIALKEKDKQINKMNKLFNGKELVDLFI